MIMKDEELYRKTRDGLNWIFFGIPTLGAIFPFIGYVCVNNDWGNMIGDLFLILFTPVFYIGSSIKNRIKTHHVYPRTGLVKIEEKRKERVVSILFFIIFFLYPFPLMASFFAFNHPLYGNPLFTWLRWWPLFTGIGTIGPFLYLMRRTGQHRYLLFGLLAMIDGLLISIPYFPHPFANMDLFLFSCAVALVLYGLFTFKKFLHSNPIVMTSENKTKP